MLVAARRIDKRLLKLWDDLDNDVLSVREFFIKASNFFEPDEVG